MEAGLMTPPGIVAVTTAKQNGSWDSLDLSDNLIYPPELIVFFDNYPRAENNFKSFPTGSQRNSLQWIYDAKTSQTKTRRAKQVAEAAQQNQRMR